MSECSDFIKKWIFKKTGIERKDISLDKHIFENGYVDSIGLFSLVFELEDEFKIQISDDDLMDDRIKSINGICKLISTKSVD